MSEGKAVEVPEIEGHSGLGDMLRRVRVVDPSADADAVRRYGHEIDEADAVLQTLTLDPSHDPLDVSFSPDWPVERTS